MMFDLIIDGNYILSRLVFTLHKNNLLYGSLEQALNNTISNYKKMYSFENIYLVSDSKEKYWRKKIVKSYKSNRKKDSKIDWNFVYKTYQDFKDSLKRVKVLEAPSVEGDDWISYLCEKSNSEKKSVIIISNDYDIKQLIKYSLDPTWINIMSNDMYNRKKIFVPKNYKIFLSKLNSLPIDDIFELVDNKKNAKLILDLIEQHEIIEVDYIKSLIVKIISGDKSDNISSVWSKISKNGRKIGIGEKGAQNIYNRYIEEFGEVDLKDPDLYENIADLICEVKKISKTKLEKISNNIELNSNLINLSLDNIPDYIVDKMTEVYEN